MVVVQRNMALIIRERERLVNTGFSGGGPAFNSFFCDRSMVRNNSMIRITETLVQGTLATHLRRYEIGVALTDLQSFVVNARLQNRQANRSRA